MILRTTLHTLPSQELEAARQRLKDRATPLSLSEFASFVRHADERVPLALLQGRKDEREMAAWAIYDRAVTEADPQGEIWNPLLDAAALAIEEESRSLPKSPEGNPPPGERAERLAPWAEAATASELQGQLALFRSEALRGVLVQHARDLTRKRVEEWLDEMPLHRLAENRTLLASPTLSGPLVLWCSAEITGGEVNESYAATLLRRLLEGGWEMDEDTRQGLLADVSRTGLIDHEEEPDERANHCYPAASVLVHPRASLSSAQWKKLLHAIPLEAVREVLEMMGRQDAPPEAFGILFERLEKAGRYGYIEEILTGLATHPALADAALRERFFKRGGFQSRLALVPRLTPEEYWRHTESLGTLYREILEWLKAATPAQRAAATPALLLPFLQHRMAEVRLQAQTFVGAQEQEREVRAEFRPAPPLLDRRAGR